MHRFTSNSNNSSIFSKYLQPQINALFGQLGLPLKPESSESLSSEADTAERDSTSCSAQENPSSSIAVEKNSLNVPPAVRNTRQSRCIATQPAKETSTSAINATSKTKPSLLKHKKAQETTLLKCKKAQEVVDQLEGELSELSEYDDEDTQYMKFLILWHMVGKDENHWYSEDDLRLQMSDLTPGLRHIELLQNLFEPTALASHIKDLKQTYGETSLKYFKEDLNNLQKYIDDIVKVNMDQNMLTCYLQFNLLLTEQVNPDHSPDRQKPDSSCYPTSTYMMLDKTHSWCHAPACLARPSYCYSARLDTPNTAQNQSYPSFAQLATAIDTYVTELSKIAGRKARANWQRDHVQEN
ncbi:hypothetical protein C8J56DRAFT_900441 [Mycena floridula]|nr:hypothetical protein C8J56DRAFT_900441 [Mycena floridula]